MRLASDNSGPVHPKIMAAINEANQGYALPYGNDIWTDRATALIREVFEAPNAAVYLTATGTAANALALATLCAPFDTVFCTPEAHIEEDECNAPEFFTGGAKLTLVDSQNAKMQPEALQKALEKRAGRNVHAAQNGALSLTQLTERGTVYSLTELAHLTALAKSQNVPVHLDGARFANACVALDCSPAEMSWKAGVDVVSFGGTKNGCLGVEAVILFDPARAWEFELRRKRAGHLFSKSRYLGAQMVGYLQDDTWRHMARAANAAAAKLAEGLAAISDVNFLFQPAGNMLFVEFPVAAHRSLQDAGAQYYPARNINGLAASEMVAARLVADWSFSQGDVEQFVDLIANR